MELAVGRLMDKSINVVKSAIQLLAAFIAHNPYSCKVTQTNRIHNCGDISIFHILTRICLFQLSSADLKKPLEKETVKLREMKEKLEGKAPGTPLVGKSYFYSCWIHIVPNDETKANTSSLNESWVLLCFDWQVILAVQGRFPALL